MTRVLFVAAACALLGGCVESSAPPTDDAPEFVEERQDPSFGPVDTGPPAGPDPNATTVAPPRLVPGEWWRIRFESPFFAEAPEFVRVVADAHEGGYVVGMPHEGWHKEALAYHSPGFGDVAHDLSYDLHNLRFEPLRFPLTTGATWRTHFGPSEFEATVETANEAQASIVFETVADDPQPTDPVFALLNPLGDAGTMRLVYDARQHDVVRFESAIGRWEAIEHGYNFTGWVTVPRGVHTVIDYGQFLAATPGEPLVTRTQWVEGGFNRLTLLQAVYALGPGSYRVTATAPDSTPYRTEATTTGSSLTFGFFEAADPDGQWTLEDVVVGPGGTYSMGMAYHQYDIRPSDGARRADHAHPIIR